MGMIRQLPAQEAEESDVGMDRIPETAALLGGVPYPLGVVGAWFEDDAVDGGVESKLFLGLGSGGTAGGTVDRRRRGQAPIIDLVAGHGIAKRLGGSFGMHLEKGADHVGNLILSERAYILSSERAKSHIARGRFVIAAIGSSRLHVVAPREYMIACMRNIMCLVVRVGVAFCSAIRPLG